MGVNHSTRKHSKFSASGATRWFNCPGSVELSEGVPEKQSVWSLEGTLAHEVLELTVKAMITGVDLSSHEWGKDVTPQMIELAKNTATRLIDQQEKFPGSHLMVETRIHLAFIHPEMFGTFDGAVVDYFGRLNVWDYKFGQGHSVSPVQNLQMLFYGIGVAHEHHWNFKSVRLYIDQPRIKNYKGPVFWELPILELKAWVPKFRAAVLEVEASPDRYVEGPWCHWCPANRSNRCPLKREAKYEQAKSVFSKGVLSNDEIEKEHQKETTRRQVRSKKEEDDESESRAVRRDRRVRETDAPGVSSQELDFHRTKALYGDFGGG